jgi:polar amino acid transport system substrate-binding protein
MRILLILGIVLSFALPRIAAAEVLRVGLNPTKPPYDFIQDGKPTGIEWDIVNAVLGPSGAGYTIELIYMSNSRLEVSLSGGRVDAVVSVRAKADDGFYYSDDFVSFDNFVISRKSSHLKINSIADLAGHSFAIWQHGWNDLGLEFRQIYGPAGSQAARRECIEFPKQGNQNLFFWSRRSELIIVDKVIFLWYRKQLSQQIDTSDEIEYHKIFYPHTSFQVGFVSKDVRDTFNTGLRKLNASGQYQQIIQKYVSLEP